MFHNYISVCPVHGQSEIVLGQGGLNKKKDNNNCYFLKSKLIHIGINVTCNFTEKKYYSKFVWNTKHR